MKNRINKKAILNYLGYQNQDLSDEFLAEMDEADIVWVAKQTKFGKYVGSELILY